MLETAEAEKSTEFDATGFLGKSPDPIVPATPPATPPKQVETNPLDPTKSAAAPPATEPTKEVAVDPEKKTEQPPAPVTEAEKQFQLTVSESGLEELLSAFNLTDRRDTLSVGDLIGVAKKLNNQVTAFEQMAINNRSYDNDVIANLKTQLEGDPKDKIKSELKSQGYSDEDVEDQLSIYVTNGTVEKQADLINKKITSRIDAERDRLKAEFQQNLEKMKTAAAGVSSPEQIEQNVKLFDEQLKDIDGFFGVKFGKDAQSAQEVRKAFIQSLADGSAAKAVLKDPVALATAVFVMQNKDTVEKVLHEKGLNMGKAIVINELRNKQPTVPKTGVETVPAGDGFSPDKFLAG